MPSLCLSAAWPTYIRFWPLCSDVRGKTMFYAASATHRMSKFISFACRTITGRIGASVAFYWTSPTKLLLISTAIKCFSIYDSLVTCISEFLTLCKWSQLDGRRLWDIKLNPIIVARKEQNNTNWSLLMLVTFWLFTVSVYERIER